MARIQSDFAQSGGIVRRDIGPWRAALRKRRDSTFRHLDARFAFVLVGRFRWSKVTVGAIIDFVGSFSSIHQFVFVNQQRFCVRLGKSAQRRMQRELDFDPFGANNFSQNIRFAFKNCVFHVKRKRCVRYQRCSDFRLHKSPPARAVKTSKEK